MSNYADVGLVVEGGGLRAIFSAGVMDCLLEYDIHLPYVVGVSAGAIYAASYVSRQKERNLEIQRQYLNDSRYMGFKHWLETGYYVNHDFAFRDMTESLIPFDYQQLELCGQTYEIGAFNCISGETCFFDANKQTRHDFISGLIASSSLPFISKPYLLRGEQYLDGGLGAAIPIARAQEKGYKRNLVILSRGEGYRKSAWSYSVLSRLIYARYPQVHQALLRRHTRYNTSLDKLVKLEEERKAFVIRPPEELHVSRLEKQIDKVEACYWQGYQHAEQLMPKLKLWLSGDTEPS